MGAAVYSGVFYTKIILLLTKRSISSRLEI